MYYWHTQNGPEVECGVTDTSHPQQSSQLFAG